MLVFEPALTRVIDEVKLKAEDFYLDRHRLVYTAIHRLYEQSKPVDELTVAEALTQAADIEEVGGRDYVSELAAKVPAAANARHYAEIVQENSLMRRLLGAGQSIQTWVHERAQPPRELAEQAERLLFNVAHEEQAGDFRRVDEILGVELSRLEKLSSGETDLTGTTSGFRDIDTITGGFQPGNLVVVAARPAMGKCLAGSTLIHNPLTGARQPIQDLYESARKGEDIWVTALDRSLKLRKAKAAAIARNGPKPVFRIKTRLGRELVATDNHPLLTISGWKTVGELEDGSRIAVPRTLPAPAPSGATARQLTNSELVLLAALIADGNLTNATPRFCYGEGSPMQAIVRDAAGALGVGSRPDGHGLLSLSNGYGSKSNAVTALLVDHELMGLKSEAKFVPDAIFSQPNAAIATFLGVLFACDGHLYAKSRLSQIGYTTISRRLARDVQHLLLRIGIVSKIRCLRRAVYEGTDKQALEVRVTGQEDLAAFCRQIRVPGKESAAARILDRLPMLPLATNLDTVPAAAWKEVLAAKGDLPWADISAETGRPRNHNWHVGRRGISRPLISELAAATRSERLSDLGQSDIWWDDVDSIEPAGTEETYDLQVPEHENFVANDIVVHNSAFVVNIAEAVAVKAGKAAAFFSLEMSEVELAQRFIACRSRISGDTLRKGRVSSRDWPKVVRACAELENAPLWIDDSSDLGMLDLRAKARRLHASEHARGGLGVIIVDYMQLMRAEDSRANRVEQVAQMSRGLKILARELEVPVIALSQLSRAPEQRPDPHKRPILSDLRESGSIEQDADVVAFLYRDEYYNPDSEDAGMAEVIIAKHRNGPIGTAKLAFLSQYPKFADLSRQPEPGGYGEPAAAAAAAAEMDGQ